MLRNPADSIIRAHPNLLWGQASICYGAWPQVIVGRVPEVSNVASDSVVFSLYYRFGLSLNSIYIISRTVIIGVTIIDMVVIMIRVVSNVIVIMIMAMFTTIIGTLLVTIAMGLHSVIIIGMTMSVTIVSLAIAAIIPMIICLSVSFHL